MPLPDARHQELTQELCQIHPDFVSYTVKDGEVTLYFGDSMMPSPWSKEEFKTGSRTRDIIEEIEEAAT